MTDAAIWLARRDPAPPAALAERIEDALADTAEAGAAPISEALVAAGARLLERILDDPQREALDLLAADALVTYAFEAAAEDPDRLEAFAATAMARLAALGGEPGT